MTQEPCLANAQVAFHGRHAQIRRVRNLFAGQSAEEMKFDHTGLPFIDFSQAVRIVRAALWHVWCRPLDRTTTVHDPASARTTWAVGDQASPDLLALGALTLGGLVDPADALFIAVTEAGRRGDP